MVQTHYLGDSVYNIPVHIYLFWKWILNINDGILGRTLFVARLLFSVTIYPYLECSYACFYAN